MTEQFAADDELLTTAEAAQLLKVVPETMRRWRRTKSGPPYTKVEGRALYPRSWLSAWLESRALEF